MIKNIKIQYFNLVHNKYIWLIVLSSIVIFGSYLREVRLYDVPRLGATFDEFAWTWQGMSLIETGLPQSWSPHPQYKDYHIIKYKGAYFRIVKPYLEHPPFFGFVAGSFALLSGLRDPLSLDIYHIRLLALILGTTSIILIYILASLIYGKIVGLISAGLYSIIPTVVVGSRLVQNENFFIPLWLTGLIFVYLSIKKNNKLYLIFPIIISFILVLSKIPFMAAGFSFMTIYIYHRQYKASIFVFLGILAGFLSYSFYGFYFNQNLFIELMKLQTQRYDLTFNSIFALFEKPYLADRFYTDGWILWGYVSIFILAVRNYRKHLYILIPFLIYFGIFMSGIPDEPGHGWYRYPFYPFMVIATASFLKEYFTKNHLLTFFFSVFIGTSVLQNFFYVKYGFSFVVFRLFVIFCITILLPLFTKNVVIKRTSFFISYILLIACLIMTIFSSLIFID